MNLYYLEKLIDNCNYTLITYHNRLQTFRTKQIENEREEIRNALMILFENLELCIDIINKKTE